MEPYRLHVEVKRKILFKENNQTILDKHGYSQDIIEYRPLTTQSTRPQSTDAQ
jgi:hypothetical protein